MIAMNGTSKESHESPVKAVHTSTNGPTEEFLYNNSTTRSPVVTRLRKRQAKNQANGVL